MTELTIWPNCNKKLSGFLTTKYLVKESTAEFINRNTELKSTAFCSECALPIITDLRAKGKEKIKGLMTEIEDKISLIPILTLNHPSYWDYDGSDLWPKHGLKSRYPRDPFTYDDLGKY